MPSDACIWMPSASRYVTPPVPKTLIVLAAKVSAAVLVAVNGIDTDRFAGLQVCVHKDLLQCMHMHAPWMLHSH